MAGKKKASNTENGKAFEYACLQAIQRHLNANGIKTSTVASPAFSTAQKLYEGIDPQIRADIYNGANTAAKLLIPLEPKLLHGEGLLLLSIAADAQGVKGDVRDVLCIREEEGSGGWAIGISCKHNHEALKHPRITEGKDFGKDWIGIPCSKEFIDEITPITDSLVKFGEGRILWRDIENKWDGYYVPILNAYLKEIERLCMAREDVPGKLLSYFFGTNDFYKVIMKSKAQSTTVEGFNMYGTLNTPAGRFRPTFRVPLMKMPTRLLDASFKMSAKGKKSKTTIILTFDAGWAISMRLHNKDDIAKPTSLAWNVELEGLPPSTYVNTHPWSE